MATMKGAAEHLMMRKPSCGGMHAAEEGAPRYLSNRRPSMDVRRKMPHPAIRSVVRSFEERRGMISPGGLTWPLAARPHQIIDIYLGNPFQVSLDGGPLHMAPETVVVGPQGSR